MSWHERQGLHGRVIHIPEDSFFSVVCNSALSGKSSRTLLEVFGTDPGEHLLASHYEGKFILLLIFHFCFIEFNEAYFNIAYTAHLWSTEFS
jgi:hypothetical protein